MGNSFKINPQSVDLTWQTIIDRVALGYELQEIKEDELSKEQIVKFNDSIIITPDYQREYRSSISEESSLIESALLGIPIPPIFLASQKFKGVQVLNVVDGQHRLRAFYRYFKGLFSLSNLKILGNYNGKSFQDLEIDDMTSLQSRGVSTITFRDFPGKDFELEIFSRYNKGTKPLTAQEIRHAVFDSRVNELVNEFCKRLIEEPNSPISKAYAISKDRFLKKTCQENIFVILSILENGVDQSIVTNEGKHLKLLKSPQFAEVYMEQKSLIEKEDPDKADACFAEINSLFEGFNRFILSLTSITSYPFSREIYGVSKKGNKFQVSISMILAGIYRKIVNSNFDMDLLDNIVIASIAKQIYELLNNSYLEDPEYSASTTNPIEVQKVVDAFVTPITP